MGAGQNEARRGFSCSVCAITRAVVAHDGNGFPPRADYRQSAASLTMLGDDVKPLRRMSWTKETREATGSG